MSSINLLPGAVAEILASATETGVITQADRYGLMAALLDESLNEEEARAVNRLLRFIAKGRVQVVKEISAII